MNNAKLRTNGHKLLSNNYTLRNGKIISNDTLNLQKSVIDRITFFGNYMLNGKMYSRASNVFNDTLTVLDTLMNLYGWSNTIRCNGTLINKGSILNNPSGYALNAELKGDLYNHHIMALSNLYLIGTNGRTISGSNANGIQATISVDDSIRLVGGNTLPNLSFTANPKACPMRASDLSGLPPALVIVSGYDPLRDEGIAYANRLKEAGIPVTLSVYHEMIHGFMSYLGILKQAETAIQEIAAWVWQ